MTPEILKLNKQLIFSNKATDESRKEAVMDVWENGNIKNKFDSTFIRNNVVNNPDSSSRYAIIKYCVMATLGGEYVDPNFDPDEGQSIKTKDELFSEEMFSQELNERQEDAQ